MKIIISIIMFCFSIVASAETLNKIVVFGDSLSDTGNLYEYMKHQLPLSPPYYKGRFSNGPLWIEILAEQYYPNEGKDHLLNYAFGGAGVSENADDDDMDEEALFNLRREVDSYLLAHQDKADPRSLFVVWMGSNNYLGIPDDQDTAVEEVITGLKHSIEKLVNKGAKHILLVNVPNLGQTPAARDFDAVNELTYLSAHHNARLLELQNELEARYTDVQWMLFNVNLVFDEMLNHPSKHGFHNVTDTCYEELINHPSQKSILKMASVVKPHLSQSACDGYLFFDPVHPTYPAHRLMADMVDEIFKNAGVVFE